MDLAVEDKREEFVGKGNKFEETSQTLPNFQRNAAEKGMRQYFVFSQVAQRRQLMAAHFDYQLNFPNLSHVEARTQGLLQLIVQNRFDDLSQLALFQVQIQSRIHRSQYRLLVNPAPK